MHPLRRAVPTPAPSRGGAAPARLFGKCSASIVLSLALAVMAVVVAVRLGSRIYAGRSCGPAAG
jgi:hypothetical protein